MSTSPGDITRLLSDLQQGNTEAADKLMPLIYSDLRRMAAHYFRRERPDHTLQPTALIHETYIRLLEPGSRPWKNRKYFFAAASQAMRRILVEHARARGAQKRGGSQQKLDLDEALVYEPAKSSKLVALDDALSRLEQLDPRQSRIVELRYFSGLSVKETAEVLGVSVSTVKDEWTHAKAWLREELESAQ